MTADETTAIIGRAGLVAVIRAESADDALRASTAVIEGGVRVVEVTATCRDAAGVIARLRTDHPSDVVVGGGTLRTLSEVAEATDAGAQFLVSPGSDDALLDAMLQTDLLVLAGVYTATEVTRALTRGAQLLKLFPASVAGPALLRSLLDPFPRARFVPTGGVTGSSAASWFAAGAFALGLGGTLVVRSGTSVDVPATRERARDLLSAVAAARRDAQTVNTSTEIA